MELVNFKKDYLENVNLLAAAEMIGTSSAFVRCFLDDLQSINVITDFEECFDKGQYSKKNYRVDAYSFDDFDFSMSLFIADYSGDDENKLIPTKDIRKLFDNLYVFLDGCLNGNFRNKMEISTPIYDLVDRIVNLKNKIRKFRLFIITDRTMNENISSFSAGNINNIPIEYNLWDIKRLYRVINAGEGHEPVEINFLDLSGKGLPCLEASDANTEEIMCYLCVIPGAVLADLYDQYGSLLLEGNVRSFLSAKGKINQSIKNTILEYRGENKRMFFSYNNGISATATSISLNEENDAKIIESISNLQIVNGGQTTASLSHARYKYKADLSGIFVQMKLTVIPKHEQAQLLIPKIARYSNSQNKVSDADFFSNHEFNIRMQQISRNTYAPAVNGLQYETLWFFERSRGQYEQEQSRMTDSVKKKFQMKNPKNQKITKTDLAKYHNIWNELPYYVSLGAQKNFNKFAEKITEEWDKNDTQFNEHYFRNIVVIAIMFKSVDKMIMKQDWYEKGYKANIIAYSISYLHYLISKQFNKSILNMKLIWDKQSIPEILYDELVKISKFVFLHITDENREITNVTEWCKKEKCWTVLKGKKYELNPKIAEILLSENEARTENSNAKKEYAIRNGIQVQADVVSKGQEYWEYAIAWGKEKKLLNEVEQSYLLSATRMNFGRIPSEKQCQRIINIEAKLLDEGFIWNSQK